VDGRVRPGHDGAIFQRQVAKDAKKEQKQNTVMRGLDPRIHGVTPVY
jgi:hypothetical protein